MDEGSKKERKPYAKPTFGKLDPAQILTRLTELADTKLPEEEEEAPKG